MLCGLHRGGALMMDRRAASPLGPALAPSHGRALCRRRHHPSGPRYPPWGLVSPPWFWTRGRVPDPPPSAPPDVRPAAWRLHCPRPCAITPSDFTYRAQVKGDTVKNQGSTWRTSPRAWALLRAAPQGAGHRLWAGPGLALA